MDLDIEINELLTFLDALNKKPDAKGFTSREMAKLLGLNVKSTREKIRELVKGGYLKAGFKEDTTSDGRRCYIPVYDITDKTLKMINKAKRKKR